MLLLVMKILGYFIVLNLIVLPILWILKIPFTPILIYEGSFVMIIGILLFSCTFVYRKRNRYYDMLTGWWDLKKLASLTPEERHRYRQEGITMITIGLIIVFTTMLVHLSLPIT